MTRHEFRKIRKALGLSARQMGIALALKGESLDRSIRRYEAGSVGISGPVATAMLAFAAGFRPPWWPQDAGLWVKPEVTAEQSTTGV